MQTYVKKPETTSMTDENWIRMQEIGEMRGRGSKLKEIAEKYKISHSRVSQILVRYSRIASTQFWKRVHDREKEIDYSKPGIQFK